MSWSKETMKSLHTWLVKDTWYKWHPIDNVRFYLFIGHVWKDCHGLWDEATAREIMISKAKKLHPDLSPDCLDEIMEKRKSEGTLILDFLCELKDQNKLNELIPI